MKKIVIIGGLSAGPSAAAKARREDEDAEIILFEKTNYISYATCGIPYALSGKIKTRDKLMVVKPDLLRNRFNIDLRLNEAVNAIDTDKQTVSTEKGTYAYDKLVYAAGGSPLIPPIKNLDNCDLWSTCKTIADFDKITKDGALTDKQNIAIIGAGLIGLEAAENLRKLGKTVHIIELSSAVLPILSPMYSRLAQQVLLKEGIILHLNNTAVELDLPQGKLHLKDGSTIAADYLIIGIGVRPNTALLPKADKAPNGALIVDNKMRTSIDNVYAAGDCVVLKNLQTLERQYFPMGTHSNKGGRTAGAQISETEDVTFEGAYGTAIVQLFDTAFAKTGIVPKGITADSFPYGKNMVVVGNTPGYYPNPTDVIISIYYDKETQVVVGAEACGERGVDKRIDVLSTAIYAKLTLKDLQNLDLAYAPSFSPAKDPLIVASYASENELKSNFTTVFPLELEALLEAGREIELIDVRNPAEIEKLGKIDKAKNIPLDQMRERLNEISREKEIYLYCARGLRGYIGAKILENNGIDKIHNLAGGFNVWQSLGLSINYRSNPDYTVELRPEA